MITPRPPVAGGPTAARLFAQYLAARGVPSDRVRAAVDKATIRTKLVGSLVSDGYNRAEIVAIASGAESLMAVGAQRYLAPAGRPKSCVAGLLGKGRIGGAR